MQDSGSMLLPASLKAYRGVLTSTTGIRPQKTWAAFGPDFWDAGAFEAEGQTPSFTDGGLTFEVLAIDDGDPQTTDLALVCNSGTLKIGQTAIAIGSIYGDVCVTAVVERSVTSPDQPEFSIVVNAEAAASGFSSRSTLRTNGLSQANQSTRFGESGASGSHLETVAVEFTISLQPTPVTAALVQRALGLTSTTQGVGVVALTAQAERVFVLLENAHREPSLRFPSWRGASPGCESFTVPLGVSLLEQRTTGTFREHDLINQSSYASGTFLKEFDRPPQSPFDFTADGGLVTRSGSWQNVNRLSSSSFGDALQRPAAGATGLLQRTTVADEQFSTPLPDGGLFSRHCEYERQVVFTELPLTVVRNAMKPMPMPTPCGPVNCQGCCATDGTCRAVSSQVDTVCGLQGTACRNCLSLGGRCVSGACNP